MKVALVEFNPYNHEIQPTLGYALHALGAEPDVYVLNEAVRMNAFGVQGNVDYARRDYDALLVRSRPWRRSAWRCPSAAA